MGEINNKSVKKNAALSVIKQLFSIVFPLITFPYATRVLGAVNYGRYTFSASIVNYISYIAAAGILRYAIRECARVRDDKQKLNRLVNEIFTINVLTTVVAFLVLFVALFCVPLLQEYIPYIIVISLSVVFTTIGTDWINSAYEEYAYITIRYIVCQLFSIILLFLMVRKQDSLLQYAFVSVSGGVFANILNVYHIRKHLDIKPKIVLGNCLKKHIVSILYLFACTIATFIYINSDVSILRVFADDVSVAYYGVSTQFYQLIKQLINAAFVVVIPRISNELSTNKEEALKRYKNILELTILLIVPSAIGLNIIRNNLILLVAGNEYIQAASSLGILAVAIIPAMLANYYINIIMIPLKMEKQVTVATVVSAVVNIALNCLLIPRYKENAAAFTTLIAEITMVIISMYYCRFLRIRINKKSIISAVFGGVSIFLICNFINRTIHSAIINIICCVVFSILAYAAVVMIAYKKDLLRALKKL